MSDQASIVYLTKITAARRQLDAAIRMGFLAEDAIAIHTIVAAAYRILRDIKAKRGGNEYSDPFTRGLFYVARDLASGALTQLPLDILAHPSLVEMIEGLAKEVRGGSLTDPLQLKSTHSPQAETQYWKRLNAPANFLKHADADSNALLAETNIDNTFLMKLAVAAYVDLMGKPSPEMYLFFLVSLFEDGDLAGILKTRALDALECLTSEKRNIFCLSILRDRSTRAWSDESFLSYWAGREQ